MIKISELKPSDEIFVFDKLHSEKSPTLYTVSDFIEAYKERPEDFGKAVTTIKVIQELDANLIKDALNEYFADSVICSEDFYGGDGFTTDDLWDARTLRKITAMLEDMVAQTGYFLRPHPATSNEVDYSELTPEKPDTAPTQSRKEVLEAKKERYLGILFAEVRSLLQESSMPKYIQEVTLSNIDQAAYDLGEAVFELARIEREENE